MNYKILLLFLFVSINSAWGQDKQSSATPKDNSIYFSTGVGSNTFSLGIAKGRTTTIRYSTNWGMSFHANHDFNKNIGIFSGLGLNNLGFIEKYRTQDSTVKRRVLSASIPLGIKIGQVNYGNYFYVGGAIDVPFHYKEKGFVARSRKSFTKEWFSNRTPLIIPSTFIGYQTQIGLYLHLQYYPTNFLNKNYVTKDQLRPYQNHSVQIVSLSFGWNMDYFARYAYSE